MLTSFLNKMRSAVSLCVALAFLQAQVGSSMAAERLIPGAPIATPGRQSPPVQPGEVQQAPPPAPPNDKQTTVVQVPVPKNLGLDITVVDGEGASNIIGKKSSSKTVVQVRDERNQLLEGAVVTFTAPADGPSMVFSNGLRTITVMTDKEGRARAPSMRAVNSGAFHLEVSASFRGQMVSTSISQENFESASDGNVKPVSDKRNSSAAKKSGLSGTAIAIIIGAGAAAAVGIGVGLGHKGSTTAATTTTTIGGPGTPTVGAP